MGVVVVRRSTSPTKEAIKCRHTRIASVCFLLVFQKEGENRSRLRKSVEIFFVLFCFFKVFWLVRRNSLEKVAPIYRRSLSFSTSRKISLLFVFFCLAACACCSLVLFFGTPPTLVGTLGWVHKNKKKSSVCLCLSVSLSLCPRTQHARTSDIREQSMRVSERARENEKKTSGTRNRDI